MIRATFNIHGALTSSEEFGLVGINDLQLFDGGGVPMLFAATRGNGWLSAYEVGDQAGDTGLIQQWHIRPEFLQLETTDLVVRETDGQDQLFMAGLNSTSLQGVTLSPSGSQVFGNVTSVSATGQNLGRFTEMEMVQGTQTGIAAVREGGLVNVSWGTNNTLNVSNIDEGSAFSDARATDIITATHNGQTYAFVSYGSSDAVGMFKQDAGGGFQHITDATKEDGFWVDRPSDLAVATAADGRLYTIVAGSGTDSLTTFAVSPAGTGMMPVDHIFDVGETRFADTSHVTSLQLGDHSLILAAGSDDGISMFTLLPGGRLQHISSVAGKAEVPLNGITALEAMATSDGIRIWVSTEAAPYLSELSIALPDLGISRNASASGSTLEGSSGDDVLAGASGSDRLQGEAGNDILMDGAGQDTLRGGSGADTFILTKDGTRDVIEDFQAGLDKIDLSSFGVLSGLGGMVVTPRGWGAELRIGDEVLEVHSAQGQALDSNDFGYENVISSGRLSADPALYPGSTAAPRPDLNRGYNGNTDNTNPEELTPTWYDEPTVVAQGQAGDTMGSFAGDNILTSGQNDRVFGGNGHDVISTQDGADLVDGEGGNDSISGGRHNDTLLGGAGFDTIEGGDGDDTISGGSFADLLKGGEGRDVLIGGDGFDVIYGDAGNDWVWAGASPDRVYGGDGDDWLSAGSNFGFSVDGVFGGAGNDTLFGNAGFDLLNGGDGDDVLDGGHQADNLYGEAGNDILLGGLGFDRLFGGTGNDKLYGGASGDGLFGQEGNDTMWGGEGGDRFFGGQGNDILDGGTGADTIYAGAGFDTIIGGADDDLLFGSFNADEFVFANGHGNDTIADFDATSDNEFIKFIGVDGFSVFQDVLTQSVQSGRDVIITTSSNSSIRLVNVDLDDLDEMDFAF